MNIRTTVRTRELIVEKKETLTISRNGSTRDQANNTSSEAEVGSEELQIEALIQNVLRNAGELEEEPNE